MNHKLLIKVLLTFTLVALLFLSLRRLAYEAGVIYSSKQVVQLNGVESKSIIIDTNNNAEDCLVVSFRYETEMNIDITITDTRNDNILYKTTNRSPFLGTHLGMIAIDEDIHRVKVTCQSKVANKKVFVTIIKTGSCY
jgi:Flp pilus assembly protein TadG